MFLLGVIVGILLTLAVLGAIVFLWVLGARAVITNEEEREPERRWLTRPSTR